MAQNLGFNSRSTKIKKIKVMAKNISILLIWILGVFANHTILLAQLDDVKPMQTKKERKAEQQRLAFEKVEALIRQKQFVFQAVFDQGSNMTFVVVDSIYAEVQSTNRSNLEGQVTDYEVVVNENKKTIAVTIKMRGAMRSADVFLFIGPYGDGRATISSDFSGGFSFDGNVLSFEEANIYEGKSHFIN
jgi:hypothetical protein